MAEQKRTWSLSQVPLFLELEQSKRILIAGCGGGFDVFSGIPLYFALKKKGCEVFLANLSFSSLGGLKGTSGARLEGADTLLVVNAGSHGITATGGWAPTEIYFPELYLSQWFKETQRGEISIYSFERTGVKPLYQGYQVLVKHLNVDTIILVDGGTDSLMRGDECGLGTPVEDSASICAVNDIKGVKKFLVCLGFGIDTFHGVCHAHFLENTARIASKGGFLGCFSIHSEMEEAQLFREACLSVFKKMKGSESIVCASIMSALDAKFGDFHMLPSTKGSTLFISPLMNMYWCYSLDHVAKNMLYIDKIRNTEKLVDIQKIITDFVVNLPEQREWRDIPY